MSADGDLAPSAIELRLQELSGEIRELRELVLRAYETTPLFSARLLQVRRSADYETAYRGSPLVTVRIGAYGSPEELIDRALASVIRQRYERWEAVVVCDGPAGDTQRRVEALGDSRIRCLQRPRNGPYPEAAQARWWVAGVHPFNNGVAAARGSWIAPLDQDDEWSDDHLEVLVGTAIAHRAELVYGAFRVLVGDLGETYFGAWPPVLGDFGFQAAIYHAGLSEFLYDVNAYRAGEPADWNLCRRMLEAGVLCDFVDQIVGTYHVEAADRMFDAWADRLAERGAHRTVASATTSTSTAN